jgi:hypothetical protein
VALVSEYQRIHDLLKDNQYRFSTLAIDATFVERSEDSSLDAGITGECHFVRPVIDLGNPSTNANPSRLKGRIEGCATSVPIFGGANENTMTNWSARISYSYAVPVASLNPKGLIFSRVFTFRTNESLSGFVTLQTRRTFNPWWVAHADTDFGAFLFITRKVKVFDNGNPVPVLSIDQEILRAERFDNDADIERMDFAAGIERSARDFNFTIDFNNFLTSEFAVSGLGDLVILFDYEFAVRAKGFDNFVQFGNSRGQQGIRIGNSGLVIESTEEYLAQL